MVDISIIFVNYKTKDLTINAINSVIEKTEGIEYEIFVVDNASNDGSIEAIEQKFPNIKIIKSPINGGFGYANNLAIKRANGKYIFCLNTDTLLVNNAIKIMFDFMEKDENQNIAVCGGQLLNKDYSYQNSYGYFPTLFNMIVKFGFLRNKYLIPKLENVNKCVDTIIGADIFFRKSVLDLIGLFDENIFMYGEEIELCYRIKREGYNIFFLPKAQIIHYGQASSNIENPQFDTFIKILQGVFYLIKKYKIMPLFILKLYFLIKYTIAFICTNNKYYTKALSLIFSNQIFITQEKEKYSVPTD